MLRPLVPRATATRPIIKQSLNPLAPFARSVMVPPSALSESEAAAEPVASTTQTQEGGKGRSAVKIPGPVETSMQQKVGWAVQLDQANVWGCHMGMRIYSGD